MSLGAEAGGCRRDLSESHQPLEKGRWGGWGMVTMRGRKVDKSAEGSAESPGRGRALTGPRRILLPPSQDWPRSPLAGDSPRQRTGLSRAPGSGKVSKQIKS